MPLNEQPETVLALLRTEARARARIVDEHNFRVDLGSYGLGSLRLQLFTAPGSRPVVVATQSSHGDIGRSLGGAVERYVAAVWAEFFAEQDQAPIWIERMLLGGVFPDEFVLVTFAEVEGRSVRGPDWNTITPTQMAELVGVEVDGGRGDRHVPVPEEVVLPVYTIVPVADLPQPEPFREDCLREGTVARAKALSRLRRGRRRRCCWYHRVDWNAVSELAIELVDAAQATGVAPLDISEHVQAAGLARKLDIRSFKALQSLVAPSISIQISRAGDGETSFANGQHRTQALRDAGVQRVLVVDLVLDRPIEEPAPS